MAMTTVGVRVLSVLCNGVDVVDIVGATTLLHVLVLDGNRGRGGVAGSVGHNEVSVVKEWGEEDKFGTWEQATV